MPESSLWLLNHEGNTFTLSTQQHKFTQLKRCKEDSVTLKRLSSSSWCAWALGHDHRVYIYVISSDVPIRVPDTLYENQRWMPFHGFSQRGLLPSDRYAYSDESGVKDTPKESFRLPSGHWEWEGDWMVDENLRGQVVGIEGWQYALDFPSSNYTPDKQMLSCVRKRKWMRFRRFISTDRWVRISDMEVVERSECFIDISIGGFDLPSQPPGFLSVWAVTNNGHVYVRTNVCRDKPEGNSWKEISLGSNLGIIDVCVGASNLVWAITWDGQALVRTGINRKCIHGTQWEVVECPADNIRFMQVGVGKNVVWALSREGKVWFRKGTCGDDIQGNISSVLGSLWVEMVGEMSHIAVSANDQVFAIDLNGKVFFRTGVTSSNLTGKTWQPVSLRENISIFQQVMSEACTCVQENPYSIYMCDYHRNKELTASLTTSCSSNFNDDTSSDVFLPFYSDSDHVDGESDRTDVFQSPTEEESFPYPAQAPTDPGINEHFTSETARAFKQENDEAGNLGSKEGNNEENARVSKEGSNGEEDMDAYVAYLIDDNVKNKKYDEESHLEKKSREVEGVSEELIDADRFVVETDRHQSTASSGEPNQNLLEIDNQIVPSGANDENAATKMENTYDGEDESFRDKESDHRMITNADAVVATADHKTDRNQLKSAKHKAKVRYVDIQDSLPVENSTDPLVFKKSPRIHRKKKKRTEKEHNGNSVTVQNSENGRQLDSTEMFGSLDQEFQSLDYPESEPKSIEYLLDSMESKDAPERTVGTEDKQAERTVDTEDKKTDLNPKDSILDTSKNSEHVDLNINVESLTESDQLRGGQAELNSNDFRRLSLDPDSPVSDRIIDFVSFCCDEDDSSDGVDGSTLNGNENNSQKVVPIKKMESEPSEMKEYFKSSVNMKSFSSVQSDTSAQVSSSSGSQTPELSQMIPLQPAQTNFRYRQTPSPSVPSVPDFTSLNPLTLAQTRYAWKWLDASAVHIDSPESIAWLKDNDEDLKDNKDSLKISRTLRDDILMKLIKRNRKEIHQFRNFEQAVIKSTWVKKAVMQIFLERGGGHWLPCNVELEQSNIEHKSKCLSLVYSPKRIQTLKQVALKEATCVKSSSNPDLRTAFNIYTSTNIQNPYMLQAPSEAEAIEWISLLSAANADQCNINRPIPAGSVWSCTKLGDVLVSPVQSVDEKVENFFWGHHGGHITLVETGAGGITWAIGFDRMPYVYNGGYGGAVCTDVPSMNNNLQEMTDFDRVYVYENHKWFPVIGWCSKLMLNNNFNWITQTGRSVDSQDGVKLPSSKWQWVSEWTIDFNTPGAVNSEGWQFSTQLFGDFHPDQHIRDVHRRRRWVRTCRLTTQGPWLSAGSLSLLDISIQVDPVSSSTESIVIWAVGTNGNVLSRYGVSKDNPMGQSWVHVPTHLDIPFLSISVGGGWRVWGIASDGSAWFRSGVTQYNPKGKLWLQVVECPTGNGILKHVSAGATAVWAVDSEDNLWYRKDITKTYPEGTRWEPVASKVKRVSVGSNNEVWIIAHSKFINSNQGPGVIYRRLGISENKPEGTKWEKIIGDGWSHVSIRGRKEQLES